MKKYLDYLWPLIGLVAVVWSVDLLWDKLKSEAGTDAAIQTLLEQGGLWDNLKIVASRIAQKIGLISPDAFLHAGLATLVAYAALAWYDRIALIHLGKEKGFSWAYISVCSFVTYALSHNIGASVVSGGMVRYRAYTAKGLSAAEVAVLVALCSFTFAFGTILLMGLVLIYEPEILRPLARLSPKFAIGDGAARLIGYALLGFCALYTIGAWLKFKPLRIGKFELIYPRLPIVARQYLAAPLELAGAAGIIYFALPDQGNPGFLIVLGAFLLSFSAGLLSQVPGGVGVMEAVFLAVMPGVPAPAVFAALLVWRMFYLIIPLVISLPVVLLFERTQLRQHARAAAIAQAQEKAKTADPPLA
jgi:glycosyltransferase 2 family protein